MSAAKKVLVADDDRDVLRLLTMSLARAGYQVVSAQDGCQAMDAACKHQPDVLLLDVNMPAGGGLSIQQRLQNIAAMCISPVIYLTGDKSEQVREDARKLGAYAVLYKPLDIPHMLQCVKHAMVSRRVAELEPSQ